MKLRRGRCGACYKRLLRGADSPVRRSGDLVLPPGIADLLLSVPNTSPSFPARVFSCVDSSGDCWEWTGTLDDAGYGVIGRGARGAGNMLAHRAVWELLVGPIPPGMQRDHLCRNHACVTPDHGEIVTPAENKRRGYSMAVLYAKRADCNYGHPLDGVTRTAGGTLRYCKTCAREKSRARYVPKGPRRSCKYGHAFTPENTYIDPGRGRRACRTCKLDRQREARAQARQNILPVPEFTECAA